MPKLTMCKGLPGSGKTTWALDQCSLLTIPPSVRVNQDDIRKEHFGWTSWATWDFNSETEKRVYAIKVRNIATALASGFNVINDDTNMGRAKKVAMEQLARENNATFEIRDFTNVPVEECIRRDATRPENARVGRRVIEVMAVKYLSNVSNAGAASYARFDPVGKQDPTLPAAIICDLDGTLADFKTSGHRGPYDATLCEGDDLVVPVYRLIHAMHYKAGYNIIYLSGREEKYYAPTRMFLQKHKCPEWSSPTLLMRKTNDKRADWIVKGELFDDVIRGNYYIDFVLDDRDQVVNFWRHIGLTCFQVAAGAF